MGVIVQLTPKFNAELAGEGVEYSWAHAKAFYSRVSVSKKKGRENFKQLVKEFTCLVTVLTKDRIEKFASRARAYICTSHCLEQCAAAVSECNSSVAAAGATIKQELLYSEIKWLMKASKGHRCVLDFLRGFVDSQLIEVAMTTNDDEMK